MSDAPTSKLEQQLTELTAWRGPVPGLWRRALAETQPARAIDAKPGIPGRRVAGWLIGGVAAAVLILAALFVGLPSLSRAREVSYPARLRAQESSATDAGAHFGTAGKTPEPIYPYDYAATAQQPAPGGALGFSGGGRVALHSKGSPPPATEGHASESPPVVERQVVRKATIELMATDVRAVFLKACQLVSEAHGEYVQDSSLTGSGEHMEAHLTLRIASDRLSNILNELRQLGVVRSENTGGEDVTAQVVDLEARLRNEQRVETELLTLLEKRTDAPLKEILELRSSIAGVRQTIEQLTAQRERLGHLVSLATVLVIIRPANAPVPTQAGLWSHFVSALRHAVRDGTHFLADTLAVLVSVLIGGLVWWLLAIVVIVAVRAYRRRARQVAP